MYTENYKIKSLLEDYLISEDTCSFLEYVKLCAESDEYFYSFAIGEETNGWNITEEQQKKWENFLKEVALYNEEATAEKFEANS